MNLFKFLIYSAIILFILIHMPLWIAGIIALIIVWLIFTIHSEWKAVIATLPAAPKPEPPLRQPAWGPPRRADDADDEKVRLLIKAYNDRKDPTQWWRY